MPAGEYLLVHCANPRFDLLERDYENNAAAIRIRLTWEKGAEGEPGVTVLRVRAPAEACERVLRIA